MVRKNWKKEEDINKIYSGWSRSLPPILGQSHECGRHCQVEPGRYHDCKCPTPKNEKQQWKAHSVHFASCRQQAQPISLPRCGMPKLKPVSPIFRATHPAFAPSIGIPPTNVTCLTLSLFRPPLLIYLLGLDLLVTASKDGTFRIWDTRYKRTEESTETRNSRENKKEYFLSCQHD